MLTAHKGTVKGTTMMASTGQHSNVLCNEADPELGGAVCDTD